LFYLIPLLRQSR